MSSSTIVHAKTDTPVVQSALERGVPRFLSHVMEHALLVNRRKADDFLRHFSPHTIMTALSDDAELRATILEPTTGVRRKVALRKSPGSAADDLSFAIDELETDAAAILTFFRADERVRYLPASDLWAFLIEGDFWLDTAAASERSTFARHLAFIVAQALENELINARDVIESIGPNELANYLPKELVADIFAKTLEASRLGKTFGDVEFLAALPPMTLVEHLPLSLLWNRIIVPHVALAHRLASSAKGETNPAKHENSAPGEGEKALAAQGATPSNPKNGASPNKNDASRHDQNRSNSNHGQKQSPRLSLRNNASAPVQTGIEHGKGSAPELKESSRAASAGQEDNNELRELLDDAFDSLQG
jgi:hypothetical protein